MDVKEFLLEVRAVVAPLTKPDPGVAVPSFHRGEGGGNCSMSMEEGCRGIDLPLFGVRVPSLGVLYPDAFMLSGYFSLKEAMMGWW